MIEAVGELNQGERVSPRVPVQRSDDRWRKRSPGTDSEQLARRLEVQPLEPEDWDVGAGEQCAKPLAQAYHDGHPVGLKAP